MENIILKTLNKKGLTVDDLFEMVPPPLFSSQRAYIMGRNPCYPITLKEASDIAQFLDVSIFDLFPTLYKPKSISYYEKVATTPVYPHLDAEVDKRLGEMS